MAQPGEHPPKRSDLVERVMASVINRQLDSSLNALQEPLDLGLIRCLQETMGTTLSL